jgi:hypothetical protein
MEKHGLTFLVMRFTDVPTDLLGFLCVLCGKLLFKGLWLGALRAFMVKSFFAKS